MNKVLVVVAHPDDEVIGCGGTIARHVKNGEIVQVVFLADGFGSRDDGVDRSKPASDAAIFLGCNPPIFLNLPDNQLDKLPLLDIVKKVETIVSRFKPDIVYTHNFGDLNIDHQIVNKAVITSCRPQRKTSVKTLLFFEIPSSTEWQVSKSKNIFNPNWFEDIDAELNLKIKALKAYKNELRNWPHPRSIKGVKALATWRGASAGFGAAEAFILGRKI